MTSQPQSADPHGPGRPGAPAVPPSRADGALAGVPEHPPSPAPGAELIVVVERLRAELDAQAREQRARAVVEQAKGMLAERLGCDVEAAHEHLLRLAAEADVDPPVAAAILLGTSVDETKADEPDGGVPDRPGGAVFDPATYLTPSPASTSGDAVQDDQTAGAPAPREPDAAAPVHDAAPDGAAPVDGADGGVRPIAGLPGPELLPAGLAAARQLAGVAVAEARTGDELARRVAEEALGWLGAESVLVTSLEPDGALRIVGAHGLDAHVVSAWARIPPLGDIGLVRTVCGGVPLWSADPSALTLVGAAARRPGSHSCLPLSVGGRVVGAAEIGWTAGTVLDDGARRYVRSVLTACARRLAELAPESGAAAGAPWLRALLDAIQTPSALMSPVRDASGRVLDFQVDAVNSEATDLSGRGPAEIVGARLLETYPGLAVAGLFADYVRVLESGVPLRAGPRPYTSLNGGGRRVPATLTVRACRVGGGVLVSWQFDGESADLAAQLAQAQRLGNLGWSRWDLTTGEVRWSDQLYTIFGRSRAAGPLPPARLDECVVREDLPRAEHLMRTLLGRREPADVELRVRVGADVRHLRVMAEPILDPLGGPVALHTVFQDVSQRRRSDEMLAVTRQQLQRERQRIAEERHIAIELQRAILPLPRGPRTLPGLRVAVRYLPAQSQTRVGGDWYEATALSDDEVFLAVGDVSGHGLAAAAAMARLRNALSGLACTGAPPDELLTWLNRLVMHRRRSLTASVIAARFRPDTRTLLWARAGHPPPVLLRDGRARLLDGPDGVLLGALDDPPLGLATLEMEPGDVLLLYTDGLVERRDRDLTEGFGLLREAVQQRPDAGPDELIEHVLTALGAANPNDDTCLLAVRVA
ncbi:SpoIIE family protein phosphatase [Actinomadura oligospora]|uniref:SpoIIE family protein phosphatase n=1 Tax=Actinomadura oligospora TaxID=111804 RepID=UPI0004B70866|nr:SpoIIE family protein phosphatase [Actinomadura oligospora]